MHSSIFQNFIEQYASQAERSAAQRMEVLDVQFEKGHVRGQVMEGRSYITSINYSEQKISNSVCTCFHDKVGPCRHIIATLTRVDEILSQQPGEEEEEIGTINYQKDKNSFTLFDQQVLDLDDREIARISMPIPAQTKYESRLDLRKATMGVQSMSAQVNKGFKEDWLVRIQQGEKHLDVACTCYNPSKKLCDHIHFVFLQILRDHDLQYPFNTFERHQLYEKHAVKLGLEAVDNWDDLFSLSYDYNRLHIQSNYTLLSLTDIEKDQLKKQLLPEFKLPKVEHGTGIRFLLAEESPYTKQLLFKLFESGTTKGGELKTPFSEVDLSAQMRMHREADKLLFFAALLQQDPYKEQAQLYADLVANPLDFPVYYHVDAANNKRMSAKNLERVTMTEANVHGQIYVKQSGDFYVMQCEIRVENKWLNSKFIQLLGSFYLTEDKLFFIANETIVKVIRFFTSKNHEVFIHKTQFEAFKTDFLEPLEDHVSVQYSFIQKAPAKLIKEKALNKISDYLIYLSESEDFILISPVVMYGDVEVNVLSKRMVMTENPDGTLFSIDRLPKKEQQFISDIQSQHPNFHLATHQPFFYLHKNEFLDGRWFLEVFEYWRSKGYAILGFNQIKNNRLNANKMNVSMTVKSGIDWFDTDIKVQFGKQDVSLKDVQKAVLNRARFVTLGDGTQGILPEEWIQKFALQFRHGEIEGETLRVHKSNFLQIDQLFEDKLLTESVRMEVQTLKKRLADFQKIKSVKVPKSLNAELRSYQKEGLNWLNFLDEMGFGGCLADDMGLGKTIQMIAFLLLQKEKGIKEPNLVVVPTSLLFNWQRELERFAPTLKFAIIHGNNRVLTKQLVQDNDILITTYGTLISDIDFLRKVNFNLLVLDESQAIKNPSSKRYKAVRLLTARMHVALTGTPIENNTFDLYAQLSFAMPGLLGSAKRFADEFAIPIDKFQDAGRAKELQQKIHPFLLRRTKDQVAKELPPKTEMILYCEMDTEQQRIYDLYKMEFQKYLAGLSDDELHTSSLHVLQGLTKLRQICNSPALLADEEFYGSESAKIDVLLDQIDQLAGQHKLVIFSQFVGMLDLIKERLEQRELKYAYLTGQTKDREAQVNLFQENSDVRLFLVSLKAGGTGLNLTEADYVFLVDPWWNPAVENQAIDRAHRIGQKNKVVAIRFITPNTIEEKILELQERKKALSTELIHTDLNAFKQLTKSDLMSIL